MSFAATAVVAQVRNYTMEECGNDPLLYIEKNYEDQPERYVGRKMSEFLDECPLKPNEFYPSIYRQMEGGSDPREGKVTKLYLVYYGPDGYDYTISFSFSPPYTYDEEHFNRLMNDTERALWEWYWGDKYYHFFKDYVIDDMRIFKEDKHLKPLKNYRRPEYSTARRLYYDDLLRYVNNSNMKFGEPYEVFDYTDVLVGSKMWRVVFGSYNFLTNFVHKISSIGFTWPESPMSYGIQWRGVYRPKNLLMHPDSTPLKSSSSHNGKYFVEVPLSNEEKILIFVTTSDQLILISLTKNGPSVIFDRGGRITDFDFSNGNFSITYEPQYGTSQKAGRIYKKEGVLWIQEQI